MPIDPLIPRERFEQHHSRWLAPYAVREADSMGRKYPEPPHAYRTCFQRDRDRIVHCSAFRRLDFKTQVFVPHERDHFRTRLTHTLEVAQVARSMGRALCLNEDLLEATALAHDLGHSPFGHAGESVLNELMAGHGHFEHNRQSLRVVDYLEHPYPQFRGLNVTQVVRECLAKHSTRYDTPQAAEFDLAEPAPLEGQLVDLADEIAYTSADLEDALAAEWITTERLSGLTLWRRAWEVAQEEYPSARPIHQRIRACKAVLAAMADDAIVSTQACLDQRGVRSPADVRRCGGKCVAFSPLMRQAVNETQDFLLKNVYRHERSLAEVARSERLIRELFAAFLKKPELLPERYRKRIETDGLHRTICDYIAGMTDRFCREEHSRVHG